MKIVFEIENWKLKTAKRAFTLIELLIVIAIISILIGVLVPMVSRSLSRNRLASDVEVLRAKIEEARLTAGSTKTNDEQIGVNIPGIDRVGYYGIYFPPQNILGDSRNYNHKPFYAIVRLSKPFTSEDTGYCSPSTMINDALLGGGPCLVERIDLSDNVLYDLTTLLQQRMIGFVVPSEQLVELEQPVGANNCNLANGYCWVENSNGPVFDQKVLNKPYLALKYQKKIAKINIEPYTGKLLVTYSDDLAQGR